MDENIRECQWCGGIAKMLFYEGEDFYYSNFFLGSNKVRIFICSDCGKVQVEDYEEV